MLLIVFKHMSAYNQPSGAGRHPIYTHATKSGQLTASFNTRWECTSPQTSWHISYSLNVLLVY